MLIATLPAQITEQDIHHFVKSNNVLEIAQYQIAVGDIDENNQKQGLHRIYRRGQGNVFFCAAAFNYQDDKQHGIQQSWFENGQKATEENFTQGKKTGLSRAWNMSGQILHQEEYRWGNFHDTQSYWYSNGKPKASYQYEFGSQIGYQTEWHENGNRKSLNFYRNGRLHNAQRTWDENGKLTNVAMYHKGKKIRSYNTHLRMIQFADTALAVFGHKADRDATTLANDQFNALLHRHYSLVHSG